MNGKKAGGNNNLNKNNSNKNQGIPIMSYEDRFY
jgi:hypothetical protein